MTLISAAERGVKPLAKSRASGFFFIPNAEADPFKLRINGLAKIDKGAGRGARTPMVLRPRNFESRASTSFAIPALIKE